jgi:hypothetical protein
MITGQGAFSVISALLVTAVSDALVASPAGRPERACVVPGEIAWDGCDCGMLAVSPRSWFISDAFPDASDARGSLRTSPCELPWLVANIEVQIVRCAPSPNGSVLDVPCDQLSDAANVLIADAFITLRAISIELCTLKDDDQIVDWVLGEQATVGPLGGCVGTSVIVQVAVDR